MNARDLFEAIGMVDEDLVEEADGPVRRPAWTPRRVMGRVLSVAACLCIVGAAVLSFGRGMFSAKSSAGAMLQNEAAGGAADAAPETAPDTAQAPAFYDAADDAASEKSAGSMGIPAELAEKMTPTSGAGSGVALMAYDYTEIARVDPLEGELPQALAIYRGTLAGRCLNTDAMTDTMRSALTALGYDPALADDAQLTTGYDEESTQDPEAVAQSLYEKFGIGSELDYWSGLAWMEVDLPDGGSLSVNNELTLTVTLTGDETGALTDAQAAEEADTILKANAGLLDALGGYDAMGLTGGDYSYDGTRQQFWAVLYRTGETPSEQLAGYDLAQASFSADGTGKLLSLTIPGAALAESVGEYPLISREEAAALLAGGSYLNAQYDESAPAAADIEQAESYLCYTGGRALYYVPMWCFVVDEGERENTADGLHSYRPYYVPAVSLDTLGTLLAD
ncbi:hypothetical protein INF35_12965 [Subdoligranulum sp. DSM 109015]|uniref:Uncharacterized protein n=1 Tax=Gemmiger gallinarum TaxID=2779354 RepID=A0ABR9R6D1_9FIRM|nr:hypothetical protein [Gemmiger gallinarum]MBE5038699.1 hypothetical protein [Gemmiger gallinarum]